MEMNEQRKPSREGRHLLKTVEIPLTSEGWWNDEKELKTKIDGVTTCDKLMKKQHCKTVKQM